MMERNMSLYFGSSSSGYIYKYGGVDNDNGSDIEAYWKSKDFIMGDPFVDKDITRISLSAKSINNSTVTVTYALDGSNETSYNVALYDPDSDFMKNNRILPLGKTGSTISFKIENDASDQPFEIFAIQYGYRPRPWRPSR